jgi:hypothetical protein
MLKSIEGIYRDGKIELREAPTNIPDKTQVIVTFLESGPIDLRMRGIDETQAADLRGRLSAFAEDWENPDMDVYDDYDAAKAKL